MGAAGKRIAVIGGGKTGADAVVHLVKQGIDMKNIVWVKKFDLSFGKRPKFYRTTRPRHTRPRVPTTQRPRALPLTRSSRHDATAPGKREKPQDAFASAEQRAANPLCPLLLSSHVKFANGIPKFWSNHAGAGTLDEHTHTPSYR